MIHFYFIVTKHNQNFIKIRAHCLYTSNTLGKGMKLLIYENTYLKYFTNIMVSKANKEHNLYLY